MHDASILARGGVSSILNAVHTRQVCSELLDLTCLSKCQVSRPKMKAHFTVTRAALQLTQRLSQGPLDGPGHTVASVASD